MSNEKNPLDDLEADVDLIAPEEPEEEIFQTPVDQEGPKLPRHLMRRSLTKEQEMWNYNIVPSGEKKLVLRVGTKAQASIMRTRLYHARTYLQRMNLIRVGHTYKDPLSDWSLSLEEIGGIWYVVAYDLGLENSWEVPKE